MANSIQPSAAYDPIKMLRDYLEDNPKTPGFFRNFLINRLGDQIMWYDRRSGQFKQQWEKYRRIVIILSASIPFLAGLIDQFPEGDYGVNLNIPIKFIIGLAGVIIAILEGLNALYKGQELYIEYRVTAEQLRQEFSYFLGQAGDYVGGGDAAYGKLVAKVEGIMSTQNNKWAEVARNTERAAISEDISKAVEDHLKKYGWLAPEGSRQNPPPASEDSAADEEPSAPPAAPPAEDTPPATGDVANENQPASDEALDEEMPDEEEEDGAKG